MASVDASNFARVRIVAPRTRVDVALPNDLVLLDLIPSILELVGERASDVAEAGWILTDVDGSPLALDKSLDASDLRDGATLRLRPGLELVDPPLYDDVVDAIAETVDSRVDRRDPALVLAAAVVVGCLAGAAGLLAYVGGFPAALSGLIAAALCVTLAAQAARSSRMPQIAVALVAAGCGLAFVGGESIVPRPWSWPHMLLGICAALIAAIVGQLATGIRSAVLTALQTAVGLWTIGALVGVIWQDSGTQVGAGVAMVAVALSAITPWLAMRFARLPVPIVPDSSEDLQAYDPRQDIAEAPQRTAHGVSYLHGLVLGTAAAAGSGVACAAMSGSWWAVGFALVVFIALLLRTRFLPDAVARSSAVAVLIAGAGATLIVFGLSTDDVALWSLAGVLGIGGLIGALATITSRNRRISPVSARMIDIAEGLSTVLVLPLGLAVLHLYAYVRGL